MSAPSSMRYLSPGSLSPARPPSTGDNVSVLKGTLSFAYGSPVFHFPSQEGIMKSLKRLFSNDTHGTWSRRKFIGASIFAGLASACGVKNADLANGTTSEEIAEKLAGENIYTTFLGVAPHLPTHDHITRFGGSRMPEEVLQAMAEANDYFVDMDELTIAAGKRVAEVVHAEAALITSGAFGGLVLGSAACLTGTDTDKMKALPHPSWSKKECLIQTPHRFFYDRAYRTAGMTIVEVETREQFINAINENTAMTACLAMAEHEHAGDPSVMMPEEHVEIGRKTGVPVMIDAASELPPTENLTRYTEMGGDLVIISGGKGLRGPQSTGILAGRADLIEAARLLARRGTDTRITLAGRSDPENPSAIPQWQLDQWAKDGIVEVLGHVADVPGLWGQCHIAVLPSYYGEGVPLSLIEAAACARPMVAADGPGLRDIVRHGETGLLVPARDAGALADAIEKLSQDPELRRRLGQAARRLAEEKFGAETIIAQTLEIYGDLLGDAWPKARTQDMTDVPT
ncbi:MAG TPA: glycosyltransferase [candidate division Zixibacteria bacterium]|nr:glycosyltransferase [candidate division Zixibacteria bacterium]